MAAKKKTVEKTPEYAPQKTTGSVTVHWHGKSRTYSATIHGVDFVALAEEFAQKVGGTLEGK